MTFSWVRLYWHQNLLLEHTLKPWENPSPILSVCWGKVVFKVSRNFSIALWDLWAGPKGGPFLFHNLKNANNSFWSKHEMCAPYRNTLYVMWKAELCSSVRLQVTEMFSFPVHSWKSSTPAASFRRLSMFWTYPVVPIKGLQIIN